MEIAPIFDRFHAKVVRSVVLQKLADFTRILLAVGFFAPGLHKFMGIPFTTLALDNPVGSFFDALYQTGFYYRFIGAAQVLAAILVLFRRTSTLGALLFFTITLNVFVVTISVPFGVGTPIVTGLMFLGSLFLVCWDYDKLKPMIGFSDSSVVKEQNIAIRNEHSSSIFSKLGYWVLVVAGIVLTCELRGLIPDDLKIRQIAFLASLLGGVAVISGFVIDVVKNFKMPFAERNSLTG